jgi:glutamate racemase
VYAADRQHFPYGTRSREELVSILLSLMQQLVSVVDPKIAIIACNTASVSALGALRESFPGLPFVGTVPAIKPAAAGSKKRSIGVLGTPRTVEDDYIADLAVKYGNGCSITALAAPELVDFVERRCLDASPEEKRGAVLPWIKRFREAGVDAMVLGCTHFLFLRDEFRREAEGDIAVFDSLSGISGRIESLLDEKDLRVSAENGAQKNGRFIVTGGDPPLSSWQRWADHLGFSLSLLEQAEDP